VGQSPTQSIPVAFFCVVLIVLILIAQPSGHVSDIPYHPGYVCSLPFMSALHAVTNVIGILKIFFRKRSWKTSPQAFRKNWAANSSHSTSSIVIDNASSQGKRLTVVRWLLFVIGIPTPTYMVFSTAGLWTKLITSMFLSSYVSQGLLSALNKAFNPLEELPSVEDATVLDPYTDDTELPSAQTTAVDNSIPSESDQKSQYPSLQSCIGYIFMLAHTWLWVVWFREASNASNGRSNLLTLVLGECGTCGLFLYQYYTQDRSNTSQWYLMTRTTTDILSWLTAMPTFVTLILTLILLGPAYLKGETWNNLRADVHSMLVLVILVCFNLASFVLFFVFRLKESFMFVRQQFVPLYCAVTITIGLLFLWYSRLLVASSTNP
jgi:hypothetical protein